MPHAPEPAGEIPRPKKLGQTIAHNLIFVPTAFALSDLQRLTPRRRGWMRAALAGMGAAASYGALEFVTRLAHRLDRGGGLKRHTLAALTYPPSIFLAGGMVYVPARAAWGLARRLGAKPLSRRKAALLGALPFAVAAWAAAMGPRLIRKPVRKLKVPDLPQGFEGMRIAHLSDLHSGPFCPPKRVERLIASVARMKPDMVVVTGDIVNSLPEEAEPVARALAALKAPMGVWAILGNHDRFTDGDAVAEVLRRAGIRVLLNEGEVISRHGSRMWLCGIDDGWTKRTDLGRALLGRPRRLPTLLLAHDPLFFPEAAKHGIALTLSGHTHGGQLAVPLLKQLATARAMTRFVAGTYVQGRSVLFVSRGTGLVVPPLRLGAYPEIPLLVLSRGDA